MPHNNAPIPVSSIGQPSVIASSSKPSSSGIAKSPRAPINRRNSAAEVVFRGGGSPKLIENLENGDRVGEYCIQELVVSGGFGKVFFGNSIIEPEKVVAMKLMNTSMPRQRAVAAKEIDVLRQIRSQPSCHNHLVVMSESFNYGLATVIVMEPLDCDLFDYMVKDRDWKPLEADVVLDLAQQMFKGNTALLEMNIVHSDIKLENIMIVDRNAEKLQIKLIDYGCVTSRDKVQNLKTHTLNYRAPECVLGLPTCEKADSWCFGIVIYELYTGLNLFEAANLFQLIRQHNSVTGLPDNYMLGTKVLQYIKPGSKGITFVSPPKHKDKAAGWEHKGFEKLFEYSDSGKAKKPASAADNLICDLVSSLLHRNASQRPSSHSALQFLHDGIPIGQLAELGLV